MIELQMNIISEQKLRYQIRQVGYSCQGCIPAAGSVMDAENFQK
jgi:hypothetical protein